MSNLKYLVSLITILIFLLSCGKKDDEEAGINDGLISEMEEKIMADCSENELSSKNEIENNLIGEWQLIGHGNSIFDEEPQPSINLTISNDDLIFEFKNDNVEILDTLSWEIEEINSPAGQFFRFNTAPVRSELLVTQFCEKYMYGQTSPLNADPARMYLYEKVE